MCRNLDLGKLPWVARFIILHCRYGYLEGLQGLAGCIADKQLSSRHAIHILVVEIQRWSSDSDRAVSADFTTSHRH